MFSNVGWSELMILLVAALVILGPERLPGAVRWTTRSLRQVRDYASGATAQLKQDLGPEFEDLRKPLAELNQLRGMTPRSMVTKHLLNGDDSLLRELDESVPRKGDLFSKGGPGSYLDLNSSIDAYKPPTPQKPLAHNERPPIDTDAT